MPELPEVETVRRGLVKLLEGRTIERVDLRRPDLRYPLPADFARRLAGCRIERLTRRAKYLLAHLDDGSVLLMHLGMSGSFRLLSGPPAGHDHVLFHLDNGCVVAFNDPRRFGLMDLLRQDEMTESPYLSRLGVEPLADPFDGSVLARLFRGKAAPLKAALADQRLIAGLGNIYVCEALWEAGLSPRRSAGSLVRKDGTPTARLERLAYSVRAVLESAIAAGGSTIRSYIGADGALGEFQNVFSVYERAGEPCLRPACRGTVRRVFQAGRSTYFCPVCQR